MIFVDRQNVSVGHRAIVTTRKKDYSTMRNDNEGEGVKKC
jgi:hypothetical protein